jgi:2-keto-4-pentenoate hydratase
MVRDPRIERGLLAQLTKRRRQLESGDRPLGWKLGMGVPAAMGKLGIEAPLTGYLLESGRVHDGGTVELAGWSNPKLEPEVAAHMGADVGPDASREDVERAIAGYGVAIELVDPDPDADDPEAILGANIFQRHVVLGPLVEDASLDALRARIQRGGEEAAATGDVTEVTGHPVGLVQHVANVLGHAGEHLRAGNVVICGSIVPALDVAAGDEITFEIERLGSLSVAFA